MNATTSCAAYRVVCTLQGTRVIKDPFAADAIQSAFDVDGAQANVDADAEQEEAEEPAQLDQPLWWLDTMPDGSILLNATLSDPGVMHSHVLLSLKRASSEWIGSLAPCMSHPPMMDNSLCWHRAYL